MENKQHNISDKCSLCGGEIFENEYGDIQCIKCRKVLPINTAEVPNWELIAETEDFIVDYDKTRGMYRVSYFQDNHFVDDIVFDQYEDSKCPMGCPGTLNKYDL